MYGTIISLDLETTGVNPYTDQIIEVGLVKLHNENIIETYHQLVNPGFSLPVKIRRLTNIDDSMLKDKPSINDVLPQVLDFIGDYPIIGHNVAFDQQFLNTAAPRPLVNKFYDTLELARIVMPNATNHRLATLCNFFNIDLSQQHRALDDAKATAMLAVELFKKLALLDPLLLKDLARFLSIYSSPWHDIIEIIIKQAIKQFPSGKITSVTGLRPVQEGNIGLFVEEQQENELKTLDEQEVLSYLGKNGILSQVINHYEYRPQQLTMAKAVTDSLNKGLYMLAEAGTGTGKSMAYLIPTVLWAQNNNQRVVISTHTINLQEQLWYKDIPLLQTLSGLNFQAALVKGRNNYLCLRRWYGELGSQNIKAREAEFYARILFWLTQTETGDRSELNLRWHEADLWSNICAESDVCLGKKCRFFYRLCFVTRMRRKAEQATIIIANYSLVFSDIKAENRVLPPYKVLVFDEAHHLENTATEHLGTTVTKSGVIRWLSAITKIINRLKKLPPLEDAQIWQEKLTAAKNCQQQVREAGELFFQLLANFLLYRVPTSGGKVLLRLKENNNLTKFTTEIENFVQRIRTLTTKLNQIAIDIDSYLLEEESKLSREMVLLSEQGLSLSTDIEFVCSCNSVQYVYWLEGQTYQTGQNHISLHAAPIEVGTLLHNSLYTYKDSVIFTSATLTIDNSFKHFIQRTGLNLVHPERLKKIKVDSPFSYDTQSLLYILSDFPDQRVVSEEDYLNALVDVLRDMAVVCGGRTLVLFTAHRTLRDVYYRLKPLMEEKDILLLAHDIDGSRSKIVEEFKNNQRAVLFGAASFWEGLDIPGHALSCVVLVKLPFWPPNIPIVEARTELLAQRKLNGFMHFSLPEAIIKFKQGFGRLIRTKHDHGAVVVLDRRIIDKRYGRKFLSSLPINTYMQGNKYLLLDKLKEMITDENQAL